jgi:hypothetical protein
VLASPNVEADKQTTTTCVQAFAPSAASTSVRRIDVESTAQTADKNFVQGAVSPKEMWEPYLTQTSMQAERSVKPYIGKWIAVAVPPAPKKSRSKAVKKRTPPTGKGKKSVKPKCAFRLPPKT